MGKLTEASIKDILKRDLPGFRLAERESDDLADITEAKPEASTPDWNALRQKYFGNSDKGTATNPGEEESDVAPDYSDESEDDTIVSVVPERARDAWDRGARAKGVVLSARQRKIIGSQG